MASTVPTAAAADHACCRPSSVSGGSAHPCHLPLAFQADCPWRTRRIRVTDGTVPVALRRSVRAGSSAVPWVVCGPPGRPLGPHPPIDPTSGGRPAPSEAPVGMSLDELGTTGPSPTEVIEPERAIGRHDATGRRLHPFEAIVAGAAVVERGSAEVG